MNLPSFMAMASEWSFIYTSVYFLPQIISKQTQPVHLFIKPGFEI